MINTFGMRAASLAAASAMLGLALLAAMSLTTTIRALSEAPPEPIVSIQAPTPPPPLPPRVVAPPRADPPTSFDGMALPPMDAPAALAQDPISFSQPGPVLIERPHWARRPRDLAAYFPHRALSLGVEGDVVLDCLVSAQGALDCSIISETPPNWGFGAAALRIARDHQMVPATRDGVPAPGRYRMQAPFRLAN